MNEADDPNDVRKVIQTTSSAARWQLSPARGRPIYFVTRMKRSPAAVL
jgi:hypothetical protein